jgi:hypothetical protein
MEMIDRKKTIRECFSRRSSGKRLSEFPAIQIADSIVQSPWSKENEPSCQRILVGF